MHFNSLNLNVTNVFDWRLLYFRGHPAVTCGYCSRIYSTRLNLEEHIKSRHAGLPLPPELSVSLFRSETRYQCKTCPKVFTDLADFNAHSQICIEEQRAVALGKTEPQNSKSLIDTSDISSIETDDENRDYRNAEAKLAQNPQLTILKQALTKKEESLKRNYEDSSTPDFKPRKIAKTGNYLTDSYIKRTVTFDTSGIYKTCIIII